MLLREVIVDYGATPFRFFHSWLGLSGFDQMKEIRAWISIYNRNQKGHIEGIKSKLKNIDQMVDQGMVTDDILLSRMDLMKQLHDVQSVNNRDVVQKAKVRWAIEGDENSKYFHAIINRKRAHLSMKGVLADGDWVDDPICVKKEFCNHFATRFQDPGPSRGCLNFDFPYHLNDEQNSVLESPVTRDEIRIAVWGCGEDKSPGPDGFTFEFFRKFWTVVGPDFCMAVEWFFTNGEFVKGCNYSFVALIPKVLDPKVVSDYRPISLIGSLYKVITKILATCISLVMSDLISDVQTAFLPNRQILDGPFIVNEILCRCKGKNQQAMFFKVDFAFGFGSKWRSWIRGCLCSGKASILVNGSPTAEFQFHRGIKIDSSLTLSHLFYADVAVFIGEWSNGNLIGIMNILRCFSLLSGMSINIYKSHLFGIGVSDDESIAKLKKKLSKWKLKTLSAGGRLTLLKAVLRSNPIYNMSLFKVPKQVLSSMEQMRMNFFNGVQEGKRKIAWVKWSKVLASKKGAESYQLNLLMNLLDTVILSNMKDIWFFDLNGDGRFSVNDVRCLLDDVFLPKAEVPPRWIKSIPIKINIFAWKLCLDRLPTQVNLAKRNVAVASLLCPLCDSGMEDAAHLFFRCDMAKDVIFLVSRWWDLEDRKFGSFQE
nr:hypothetical protein [Tanacetum cinerariifolium]